MSDLTPPLEKDAPLIATWSDTSSTDAALIAALRRVCETTEWEYGEVWMPNADNTVLELNPAWYVNPELEGDRLLAWRQFRYCSEEFVLHPGEGLPGRVWSSQDPKWIADVSAQSESYFLRNQIARAFGAKAGFGLLVGTEQGPIIFVFFMSIDRPAAPALMTLTESLVAQTLTSSQS